ncbi:uncharacterized protein CcaverHIS019_0400020 [Cutaneotrichosporon cavernicola]|uniref:NAD(P)-binding domain-containing protein n=1 Tax=Cutaneotrichosporon cavernicola TaxID=279322 RepID=A0AA48L3A7_9TREE|nr:uncharacterized protein CcaverHIS019_0400020 [Cutaneotrichosporon cavernicola]BEI91182.1 hypothetical protein CcaverHIS019_0400020 [Cutaneotrichosporon cavernicola]
MKFLVFGGGGRIAVLFAKLASPKHSVTSVVRNSKHDATLKSIGATPEVLDIEHATASQVLSLLKKTTPDVIVWAAAGSEGSAASMEAVDHQGARKVFDAAREANMKRVLVVSTIDARDGSLPYPKYYSEGSKLTSKTFQTAMPDYLKAKYAAEVALQASGLDFTCLRPGALTNQPASGALLGITEMARDGVTEVMDIGDMAAKLLPASRELVAQVLLASAEEPGTIGLTFQVMDGKKTVQEEIKKVVDEKIDVWKADYH